MFPKMRGGHMYWNLSKSMAAVWCLTLLTTSLVHAHITAKQDYYGKDFQGQVQSGQLKNEQLLDTLFHIVSDAHIKTKGAEDTLATNCQSASLKPDQNCIQHTALGYDGARKQMFGNIHLKQKADGTYYVKDVYCEKDFTDADFGLKGKGSDIGPGIIPGDGSILNCEHTWPQSRFTSRFPTELQKSDLHHLFPSDSEMNSHRSSLHFGEVDKDMEKLKCSQNRLGRGTGNAGTVFEPPVAHRGNVARAIFYFATRYKMKVGGAEEATLRIWNHDDPVDAEELKRNDQVEDLQGNRNPFVDFPELVDQVGSFTFTTSK
ncbi:nuclease [Bdellovibrio sp. qaytius]|nr:nuclease [Bdellovibrio sp. qaytius]